MGDVDLRMRDLFYLSSHGCRDGWVSMSETSDTLRLLRNKVERNISLRSLGKIAITNSLTHDSGSEIKPLLSVSRPYPGPLSLFDDEVVRYTPNTRGDVLVTKVAGDGGRHASRELSSDSRGRRDLGECSEN